MRITAKEALEKNRQRAASLTGKGRTPEHALRVNLGHHGACVNIEHAYLTQVRAECVQFYF
jgi:hypothetical protein